MSKKMLFVFAIATLLTCNLQAQSSSKSGSSARGNSSSYTSSSSAAAREARMMEKEVDKMAGKIARTEFAGIKLDKTQLGVLKGLTKTNYQQIMNLTSQIGSMIPTKKLSKLQRTYKAEIKEGKSDKDAMVTSMQVIGLPEMTQEKILMIADSKTGLMNKITMGVKNTLTEEQSAMLAEKRAMKEKAMVGKAETMTSKENMAKEDMAKEKMDKKMGMKGKEPGSVNK